jgi:Tfp pilus assembly protein PilN
MSWASSGFSDCVLGKTPDSIFSPSGAGRNYSGLEQGWREIVADRSELKGVKEMAASDISGTVYFGSAASFYKVMFFLSLIVLVFVPVGILSSRVWLDWDAARLQGNRSALQAEVAALTSDIAADSNEIDSLTAEELALAGSEQVFAENSDQRNLWSADVRWSEMGKLRVQAIWATKGAIRASTASTQALKRERTADLARVEARLEQDAMMQQFIEDHKLALYSLLLVGAFLVVLFALLWAALVQARINRVLQKMAR